MKREVGLIGLGKMSYRMAERLVDQGYNVVATDINPFLVSRISSYGGKGRDSIEGLVAEITNPRHVILSLPSKAIEDVINELVPNLSEGDIILDSGNSFFKDSQRHAKGLKEKGVYFLDMGISGGIEGARNGACIMIGGEKDAYFRTEGILAALSNEGSYSYLGKSGAGHLVKGYHNLVEYGFLQALAEGFASIEALSEKEGMNIKLTDVCDIWNKGSIVASRLVKDAKTALENPVEVSGSVNGQTIDEMTKLSEISRELGVDTPSCNSAIKARVDSLINPSYIGKIINSIRHVFGGHR